MVLSIFILYSQESELVSLYFKRDVRTRLGVAIFEVSGPPVFHIKVGVVSLSVLPKRQAGKLWILFFKVFWYDSARGMNPKSADSKADSNHNAIEYTIL